MRRPKKMVVFNHIICLIWALICVLSDATFGNPSDFTWKYNGEVNIGKTKMGLIIVDLLEAFWLLELFMRE